MKDFFIVIAARHRGGIAQLVERLVRKESTRNTLTLSQTGVSVPPQVKVASPVYLTLSVTRLKKRASGQKKCNKP